MQKESIIALFEDAQAAPFAKDSWQHAVDNQLVAFGRTSQEFANPHEAMAWLAEMHMELGVSNAAMARLVNLEKILEECSDNINPERGFAEELEAEIRSVLNKGEQNR